MHRIKNVATKAWLQISVAAVLAVAAGVLVTSFVPTSSASDFAQDKLQRDILADGVITQGEYTSAINRTHACIRAAGGEVIKSRFEDYRNVPVWAFAVNEPGVEPGGISIYDGCWMKFSRDVEYAWVQQEAKKITPAKKAADAQAALACAAEENLGATSVDQLREIGRSSKQVNGDVGRCLTIAQDGFDLKVHPPIQVD